MMNMDEQRGNVRRINYENMINNLLNYDELDDFWV
jgi:hypothetical protein